MLSKKERLARALLKLNEAKNWLAMAEDKLRQGDYSVAAYNANFAASEAGLLSSTLRQLADEKSKVT